MPGRSEVVATVLFAVVPEMLALMPSEVKPFIKVFQGIAETLHRSQKAQQRLEALLKRAEEDFIQKAGEAGLAQVAEWVTSLPVEDLRTFRRALEILRDRWDEGSLEDVLAQEFAQIPGIQAAQRARALDLYLSCLRERLVADPDFRTVIIGLSVLRTEQEAARLRDEVAKLHLAVNRLVGLPEDLLAWPVRPLPETVPELRAGLLHAEYRLVPFTGSACEAARDDLLAWARRLEEVRRFVQVLPDALGDLAAALLRDYRRACAEAGAAPDEGLLRSVAEALRGRDG